MAARLRYLKAAAALSACRAYNRSGDATAARPLPPSRAARVATHAQRRFARLFKALKF